MSYPIISDGDTENEKIRLLGIQVVELLNGRTGFKEAMSAVLRHRYKGRFRSLYGKVAQYLNEKSQESRKQTRLAI